MSENVDGSATAAPVAAVAAPTSAAAVLGTPAATPAAPAAVTPAAATAPLALPGKDATPADWGKFYDQIGAPRTADAYKLDVPEGADPKFAQTAAEWMAEQRLTPDQAKGLSGKWNAFIAEQKATMTAQQSAREAERVTALNSKNLAEEASLKNEWGQNHAAEMGNATKGAVNFLKPIAGEKSADVIVAIENVIGYAQTIKFLNSIGKGLGEAQARGLGGGATALTKSYADVLYPTTVNK